MQINRKTSQYNPAKPAGFFLPLIVKRYPFVKKAEWYNKFVNRR